MMIQKQVIGFGMEGCDFIVGQVSLPLWGREKTEGEREIEEEEKENMNSTRPWLWPC